jgi:hypothetical protein
MKLLQQLVCQQAAFSYVLIAAVAAAAAKLLPTGTLRAIASAAGW